MARLKWLRGINRRSGRHYLGVAYLAAGTAGLVKAAAETAMLLGHQRRNAKKLLMLQVKSNLGLNVLLWQLICFKRGVQSMLLGR